MSETNQFFEILKIVLPLLILYFAFWYTIRKMLKQENKRQLSGLRKKQAKELLSLRLQAYERMLLFLERIKPGALVLRIKSDNQKTAVFQRKLVEAIRSEFDHNLSQQLYVSDKLWKMIIAAKESDIKLVNTVVDELKPDAPAIELARLLIETYAVVDGTPIDEAIAQLKKEMRVYF